MKARMGGIKRQKMSEKMMSVNSTSLTKETANEENVIEWSTIFRRNWDIYAEFFLGITLKPYQRVALHEIGVSDSFFWRAGRGGAKSFVTACAAICKLMLYPNCWIVVTASTVDQANAIVEDKIETELIKKISPYLRYFFEKGWLEIKKPGDGYVVKNLLNNSILRVLAPVESSRRSRSNFTIYDEVAVMKKSAIDSIFEGMAFPRQPVYFDNPKYSSNKRWVEEPKSIYLTSSKYKYQWWYRTWKDCVTGYYTDIKSHYNVFATDFFDNIESGLKTWGDLRRKKKTMNDFSFRMELLNEAIGESEDAFFKIQTFKENQIIEKPFFLPTTMDIYMMKDLGNPKKKTNEIRLIVTDFAFANTTSKEKNDNTVILCMSMHWKGNRFERHVDYVGGYPAGDSLGAADRVREIFWDYDADYYIPDLRNGGETLFNYMSIRKPNPERGSMWNPSGFTIASDRNIHVVPEGKLQDLVSRTVDKNAIRCVVPMIGTPELNTAMWSELKKQLESNNIKFLLSSQDYQETLEESGEYFNLSAEDLADKMLPYAQTEDLIKEAIELKAEFKNDRIKLVENRSGTKDKIVCLAYGNYIASRIENIWMQSMQEDDFDIDDIDLVW